MMTDARLPGFVHLSMGQEAVAVGVCSELERTDRIVTTHRGHGHILAKGADVERMFAELLGRTGGYCKGKGGSMHIVAPDVGVLGANGIVGGGIPIATGAAMAAHLKGTRDVTVCFFGDGAVGQGVLYESTNLAAIWRLPIIFMCEVNGWSEWTPAGDITAGRIIDRAAAFGIPAVEVDGGLLNEVRASTAEAVARARGSEGPTLIAAHIHRLRGHHEGEEAFTGDYRADVLADEDWLETDPVAQVRRDLLAAGTSEDELAAIEEQERTRIREGLERAEQSPPPEPGDELKDLYA